MTSTLSRLALATLLAATAGAALAQTANTDQVVVPQVDRREVRVPQFPSNDFELGAFMGTFATQNFGASLVYGLRGGYHITEDFFVQATLAQTKVSDESFRQVLPSGVFPDEEEKLSYYNLSVGYNVLPGEVFLGSARAKPSQFYLIAGVGSTKLADQSQSTYNVGAGMRLYLSDRFSVQIDARDHIFSLDLLGQRETTQNLELTAGVTVHF